MGFIMTSKSFNANKVHRQKRKSKFTLVAATVDYTLIWTHCRIIQLLIYLKREHIGIFSAVWPNSMYLYWFDQIRIKVNHTCRQGKEVTKKMETSFDCLVLVIVGPKTHQAAVCSLSARPGVLWHRRYPKLSNQCLNIHN